MGNRRRRTVATTAIIGGVLLFTAACGDDAPQVSTDPGDAQDDAPAADGPDGEGQTPAPGGSSSSAGSTSAGAGAGAPADDLVVTCGAVRFDGLPADPSSFPPLDQDEYNIDLESLGVEGEFFEEYDWYIASETDDELTLFGQPREAMSAEAPPYADATLERNGDSWVPAGWGQCRISVDAEGWGNARFVLDPDVQPDPASSAISVQAWEMECASGEVPAGREVRPVVLNEDADSVTIVVLVEPVEGDANCPSNPSFPLEIELDQPLGDRAVYDASTDPALERPWPPTQSSLSNGGMEE